MDTKILLAILSVAQGLLILLLGVLGFWLKRFVKSVDNWGEIVNKMQISESAKTASCTEKHISINARLKGHDVEIDESKRTITDLDKRVTVIEKKNEKRS